MATQHLSSSTPPAEIHVCYWSPDTSCVAATPVVGFVGKAIWPQGYMKLWYVGEPHLDSRCQ
jgi:hypothetical protein